MKANRKFKEMTKNDRGFMSSSGVGTLMAVVVGTVLVILGIVLNLRVIAGLLPSLAESSVTITGVFNTTDWGDPVANDISPIFAMVVAIVILLTAVALVFSSVIIYGLRRKGFV